MILLIDNFDSFVHNQARYLRRLGQETQVVRNDAIDIAQIRTLRPAAIVLSPGPCTPREAGISLEVVRMLHTEFPILGVCLGHQTIAAALGGNVIRTAPMHGRTSPMEHTGESVFAGLPSPLVACRYHSLVVDPDSLPECLAVTARTTDGTIMGIRHRSVPTVGVQFHPEAILTEHGYALLANFLRIAGLTPSDPPALAAERHNPAPTAPAVPPMPITF